MVGVIVLFFWPAPILMKQGYLVITGVVTAYMFTFIPEWSTWVMLLAMALYDLWAVLTPHGPLKVCTLPLCCVLASLHNRQQENQQPIRQFCS